MSLLPLPDNALFLKNWRERMRFNYVISAVILTSIIVLIIASNAYMKETYIYLNNHWSNALESKKLLNWIHKIILDISVFQGYILLLFGTICCFGATARERTQRTIDFHRCSPTAKHDQVLGLMFGSTILEWCLFFALGLVNIILAIISNLDVVIIFEFLCRLMLSAILIHATAVFCGLLQARIGVGIILVGIYLLLVISSVTNMAFAHYLSWMPAYEDLSYAITSKLPFYNEHRTQMLTTFFGYPFHPLVFQIFVQIPFIGIFVSGIARKITHPDYPVLSKSLWLLTMLFILFLFTGHAYTFFTNISAQNHYHKFEYNHILYTFFFLSLTFGFLGLWSITPTQLMYLRGLRRCAKKNLSRIPFNDDHDSNVRWLFVLSCIISLFFLLQNLLYKLNWTTLLLCLLLTLVYIIFFGQLLEYFRLSKYHTKIIYLVTFLIILWILCPIVGFMFKGSKSGSSALGIIHYSLISLSPFAGGADVITSFMRKKYSTQTEFFPLLWACGVNMLLTIFVVFLAASERRKLKRSVVDTHSH